MTRSLAIYDVAQRNRDDGQESIVDSPEQHERRKHEGRPGGYSTVSECPCSDEELHDLLIKHEGLHALAARELGCTASAVRRRINRNKRLQDLLASLREEVKDYAEHTIMRKVRAGNLDASKFVLSTLGRDRGYITKQEVTVAPQEAPPDLHKLDADQLRQLADLLRSAKTVDGPSGDILEDVEYSVKD